MTLSYDIPVDEYDRYVIWDSDRLENKLQIVKNENTEERTHVIFEYRPNFWSVWLIQYFTEYPILKKLSREETIADKILCTRRILSQKLI